MRFLNLGPSTMCSRAGLRGTVVDGVRRFLLRLNGKFLFRTHRGEFAFSRRRFCISLIFCGHLLRYCILVSLGVRELARRSLKRVRVCIGCCSHRIGRSFRGPAVNVLLYGRGGSTLIRLALPGSTGVCTSTCRLCLPGGTLLRTGMGR